MGLSNLVFIDDEVFRMWEEGAEFGFLKMYIECKGESSGKDVNHRLYEAQVGEVKVNEGINEVHDDGVGKVGVDHGAYDIHVDEVGVDSEVDLNYEATIKVVIQDEPNAQDTSDEDNEENGDFNLDTIRVDESESDESFVEECETDEEYVIAR